MCTHTHTVGEIRGCDLLSADCNFYQLKVWAFTGFLKHVWRLSVGLLLPFGLSSIPISLRYPLSLRCFSSPGRWLRARKAFVPPAETSFFVCTVILSEVWAAVRTSASCTYLLHFFDQMAALICAMATGDARWVRTAGSVSARAAGGGLDATLPWKPPVPITRITREVSTSLSIPGPYRTERYTRCLPESRQLGKASAVIVAKWWWCFPFKTEETEQAVASGRAAVTHDAWVGSGRHGRSYPASHWSPRRRAWPSRPERFPMGAWRTWIAKQLTVPVCTCIAADRAGYLAIFFQLCARGLCHVLMSTTCVGGCSLLSYCAVHVPDFKGLSEVRWTVIYGKALTSLFNFPALLSGISLWNIEFVFCVYPQRWL